MALKNLQLNSPCDLFAIRFLYFFLLPFLLPTASIVADGANCRPLENSRANSQVVHLCICAPVHASASAVVHTLPSAVVGILLRTPRKLHLVRTSFHLSAACRTSRLLHCTHSQLTQLLFQTLRATEMFQQPQYFFFVFF